MVSSDVLASLQRKILHWRKREETNKAEEHTRFVQRRKPKLFFKICSEPYTYQIDIMHISRSMFFIGIEINSRWAFIEPLRSGHVQEWMTSINHLREANRDISGGRDVWCLMFDDQFSKSKEFEIYRKQNHLRGIGFVASSMHQYHGNKLGFVDRLTRTIKWYLTKLESERESEEMTLNEKVSFCLDSYNSSPHESLSKSKTGKRMSPREAFSDLGTLIDSWTSCMIYNHNIRSTLMKGFSIGDQVRVLLPLQTSISKENFHVSKEIYKIDGDTHTGFLVSCIDDGQQRCGVKEKMSKRKSVYKASELVKVKENEKIAVAMINREENSSQKKKAPQRDLKNIHYKVKSLVECKIDKEADAKESLWFKVKWEKPWDDPSYDSWEPYKNLQHLTEVMREFSRSSAWRKFRKTEDFKDEHLESKTFQKKIKKIQNL